MERKKLYEVPYTLFKYPHYPDADFWCPLCGAELEEQRTRCHSCGVYIAEETLDVQRLNAELREKFPELRCTGVAVFGL
ncbi:MAG: hypothetical protein KJ749_01810 [Planctomycetes bacterium]|nr:hypothetical protein [Planctomycetota bacterium]